MPQYLLAEHGVFEGTPEEVLARGYDPARTQLFTDALNPLQFGDTRFTWSGSGIPGGGEWAPGLSSYAPGYLPQLLDWRAAARAGTLSDLDRWQYEQAVQQARAIPMRDISTLTSGWGTADGGDWGAKLWGGAPDLGHVMLTLADKMDAGTATDQERQLFADTDRMMREQHWRASVPQASDAFSPLGDNLFGALAILGTGATAGLAAAPLAAGGAGLATTLGSLGSLAGTAGGWASTIGGATGQGWLQKLGMGLGLAGGLAGAAGGIGSALGTGLRTVGDVGRLAQGTGKLLSTVGSAANQPGLKQAANYLGLAGSLGRMGGGTQGLLSAAQQASQAGGRMADWGDWGNTDWLDWSGGGQGMLLSDAAPGLDWGSFTAGGPGSWAGQMLTDWGGGGGGGGGSVLGALGGVGSFLGKNASWLGPAVSSLGSLGTGFLGAQGSRDASAAQSAALNRALDLSEAQWLMQQQNMAPWIAAGRDALGHMQGRMAWNGPQAPGATAAISGANYALPSATPGWTPQGYQGPAPIDAAAYRYTPGQLPSAASYRYTPGQIPAAASYRYTPGALPTLSGKDLLANDPGVQFRLDEGRRALEASALARGTGMSGSTLAALQRQGQELSSQEYARAWDRAAQQAQMREGWAQTASQLGFGQAMDETRLREQVAQIASQQGWSQAQAEAALREQLSQQASAQNWQQALQGQQTAWQQGLSAQQWAQLQQQQYAQEQYRNMLEQSRLRYGQDIYQNETDYQRQQQAYQQQIAELTRQWNQFASLSGSGQVSAGTLGQLGQANTTQMGSLLGQLGSSQALGSLGPALSWQNALSGGVGAFGNLLKGLNT